MHCAVIVCFRFELNLLILQVAFAFLMFVRTLPIGRLEFPFSPLHFARRLTAHFDHCVCGIEAVVPVLIRD